MHKKTQIWCPFMESLKNKFHPLQKLGTEPILSDVHPVAIRCPSDGHLMWFGVNGPLWKLTEFRKRLKICLFMVTLRDRSFITLHGSDFTSVSIQHDLRLIRCALSLPSMRFNVLFNWVSFIELEATHVHTCVCLPVSTVADPETSERGGPRNMKYKPPRLAAIFFDLFVLGRGAKGAMSATGLSICLSGSVWGWIYKLPGEGWGARHIKSYREIVTFSNNRLTIGPQYNTNSKTS